MFKYGCHRCVCVRAGGGGGERERGTPINKPYRHVPPKGIILKCF